MKNSARSSLVVSVLLLSACSTQFNAVRVTDGTDSKDIPVSGAPYNLTFTQFDITVTRQISCDSDNNNQAKIKIKAEATPSEVRDSTRSYVIDLGSLQSFFKSTDVEVSYYDNGALKSINAKAEDKTAEFIGGVTQTITTVAEAVIAASPANLSLLNSHLSLDSQNFLAILKEGQKSLPTTSRSCSAAAIRNLRDLKKAQDELDTLNDDVTAATAQLNQYTTLVVAFGKHTSKEDRDEFNRRLRALSLQWASQLAKKAEVKALTDKVSVTDKVKWPLDGETFMAGEPVVKPLESKQYKDWFPADINHSFLEGLVAESVVYFKISGTEPLARKTSCGANCSEGDGLKYRMPAYGKLLLCNKVTASLDSSGKPGPVECDSTSEDLAYKSGPISQMGRIYVLPLKSAFLSTKSVSATFSETGVPTLLGVTSAASSDKASAMLASLGGSAASLYKSKSEIQANDMDAKIKMLTLQKQYQDAVNALNPKAPLTNADGKSADDFTASTALANAEVADLAAKKALDDARKAAN
ncbi:hypothetical protein [Rugamonas apoptosis]|uniref:Lipoprotein n=1 Tax=Rugamonas apoptosis TaxID=2758570 RepID=A0A7W2F733_9BURK|nr:hypothetical protein [Rugamonas apoptosis]MBA5686318.1 hypothetical protein [Rugamonas apoptosis]